MSLSCRPANHDESLAPIFLSELSQQRVGVESMVERCSWAQHM